MSDQTKFTHSRSDDFVGVYANNTLLESSVWDLKIAFGQLDQRRDVLGDPGVEWLTSVTVPWPQAKIFAYYLLLSIAEYEARNGFIRVPDAVRPPRLEPTPTDDPRVASFNELAEELQSRLFDESA
jgi:hypothetical protein